MILILPTVKKIKRGDPKSKGAIIRIDDPSDLQNYKFNFSSKLIDSAWPLESVWFATKTDPCTRPGNSFPNWPIATRTIYTLHAPFSKNQTITFTQIHQRHKMSFLTDLIESAFPVAYAEEVCLPWKEKRANFWGRYSHLRWQVKTPRTSRNQNKRGSRKSRARI